jgi:predicted NAD/FAD-dependent oxidoreductase
VQASYGPPGKSLVSVTVLNVAQDEIQLERNVLAQLVEWYGEVARQWTHLRTYPIPEALVLQQAGMLSPVNKPLKMSDRLFACGDYLSVASIEGGIATGIRCADEICGH